MSRTLHAQDQISHFRVLQPLGGGGMGEVYVATDESLDRDVALKILPPRLVRDEDRLRRFVTEAKSASSLNHPNIVTIYEIGKDRVRGGEPGTADTATEPVHFISMELVAGETLTAKIYDAKSDLPTLLGYVAQAAEGVAKAHSSGIIHRDLKPANIMVSNDGYAKVLDFGLAKLTEEQPDLDDHTEDPTRVVNTGEGRLIGTVGYMSPEQVQANPVDHRSDIFSLGCILYEAATKRRPFVAPTSVEVMHQILRERPVPVEEFNPDVPSEVRRIIRRCLAKNPDQRFQSMKDLAIELREVCDEYDALPVSGSSGAALAPGSLRTKPPFKRAAMAAMIVLGLLGAGGIAFGIVSAIGGRSRTASVGANDLGLSVLMTRNDLTEATLSSDGRYLAFVSTRDGKSTLNVRQVRTGSDVQIVPPQDYFVRGITFSPDGDYVYYLNQDPDSPAYNALFQVASLGGTPRKIVFDVDTAAGFSPDGSRLAFRRGMPQIKMDTLVVADVASRQEKELLRIQSPEAFQSAPAWSPDGRSVAVAVQNLEGGVRAGVRVIDVASGKQQIIGPPSLWNAVNSVGWLPDGDGIVLAGFVAGTPAPQVFRVGYPGGAVTKLTNDLSGYGGISVSAAGRAVAAVRRTGVANVWIAPADPREGAARAVTNATGTTGSSREFAPLPGGAVAFTVAESDKTHIWRAEADGSSRKQLEAEGLYASLPRYGEKSGIVFAELDEKSGLSHIWRVDPDGTGLRQLTDGKGETLLGVSKDGRTLLFQKWDDVAALWSLDLTSRAAPTRLATDALDQAGQVSPDGRLICYGTFTTVQDRLYTRQVVIPAAGGAPVAQFLLPPGATRNGWSADSASLTYVDRNKGWNLMRQAIAGGDPTALTHFTEGQTTDFAWSPDGRKIAVVRKIGNEQSVWFVDPQGGEPTKLAQFATGDLFGCRWSIDGKSVLFTYATATQDVVLIKNVA